MTDPVRSTATLRRLAPERGAPVHRTSPSSIDANGGDLGDRQFGGVATDGTVDHYGDIVEPDGGNVAVFRRNPVLVDAHNTATAGNVIGTVPSIYRSGGQWRFVAEFLPKGVSALADQLCAAVKCGAIKAVSIGFQADDWEFLNNDGFGIRFKKWTLLELSLCPIGANPSALIEERSMRRRSPQQMAAIRRALARRERLSQPVRHAADDDNPYPEYPDTPAGRQALIRDLRARHGFRKRIDARVVVADAAWRLRGLG